MAEDRRREPKLPGNAFTRTARLAALPVGYAGRTTLGVGKRIAGRPAEAVMTEVQRRTADQIFSTLGQLKGGAMKFGQAMSIFEAALPEEIVGPYREALTKLQDSAPPMPVGTVNRVMSEQFGPQWRSRFESFDNSPTASASIGQVHKGVWHDGRPVAIKIQYPGAAKALQSDLRQIARISRLFGVISPGLDVKPLVTELQDRVAEELNYALEAGSQKQFHAAYAEHPDIVIPDVVDFTSSVLITEWIDSDSSLAQIITSGSQEDRDRYGQIFARFLLGGPRIAGLLHADPHPGNFRIMADGRMGVVDFGAVARLPDGLPRVVGPLLREAINGNAVAVTDGLRQEGFIKPGVTIDPAAMEAFIAPFFKPATVDEFSFSRAWLREQLARVTGPGVEGWNTSTKVNLPPSYMLIHRVWMGAIGVLSQLEATAPFRQILLDELPGFADETEH